MAVEIQGELISQLPKTTIDGTEKVPLEKGESNNHATLSEVKEFVKKGMKTSELQNDSNFVADAEYQHTDCNFTQEEKTKLANLQGGGGNLPTEGVDTQYIEGLLFSDTYTKVNKLASECGELSSGNYDQDGNHREDERDSNVILSIKGLDRIKLSVVGDIGKDSYIFVFVDENRTVVKYEEFQGPYGGWILPKSEPYEVPFGAAYLRISGKTARLSNLKIEGYAATPIAEAGAKFDEDKCRTHNSFVEAPFIEEDVVKGYSSGLDNDLVPTPTHSVRFINITGVKTIKVDSTRINRDRYFLNYWNYKREFICTEDGTNDKAVIEIKDIPASAAFISISVKTEKLKTVKVFLEYSPIKELRLQSEYAYQVDSSVAYARSGNVKFMTGVHLDCGRKYFSVANIKILIDEISAAKLGYLQLHFCENQGFRFGLDDMNVQVDGVNVIDLSSALGDSPLGGDGSNKWLNQAEMTEIIAYADSKGVEIIPAFDMPSATHLKSIHTVLPDKYSNIYRNRQSIAFHLNLLKKYIIYFKSQGCRFFNLCGDEAGSNISLWANFVNLGIHEIITSGMAPIIYNDILSKNGMLDPYINTGVIVMNWLEEKAKEVVRSGYRTINCSSSAYYYVIKKSSDYDSTAMVKIIREHDINMYGNTLVRDNFGVFFFIWCDSATVDGADNGDGVIRVTAPMIQALGEAVAAQHK